MLLDILVYALISIAGVLISRYFLGYDKRIFIVAFSFPLGSLLLVICYLIVSIVPFPVKAPTLISSFWLCVFFTSLLLVFLVLNYKKRRLESSEILLYLFVVFAIGVLGSLFNEHALINFGGDSWMKIDLHDNILLTLKTGFPVFLQGMQSIKLFTESNIVFGFIPLWSVFLFIILFLIVFFLTDRIPNNYFNLNRILFSISAPLLLFCNGHMMMQSIYYNHHIIASIFVLIAGFCIFLYLKNNDISFIYLINLALIGYSLVRMEGVLASLIIIVVSMGNSFVKEKHRVKMILLFSLFSVPWLLFVSLGMWNGGFVTGKQYAAILALNLLYIIVILFQNKYPVKIFIKKLYFCIPLLLILVVSILMIISFDKMVVNLRVLWGHLTLVDSGGGWHYFWYGSILSMIILVILMLVKKQFDKIDILFFIFVSLFLLTIVLGGVRSFPYREPWFDSGNRMLVNFTPLLVIWIYSKYTQIMYKNKKP